MVRGPHLTEHRPHANRYQCDRPRLPRRGDRGRVRCGAPRARQLLGEPEPRRLGPADPPGRSRRAAPGDRHGDPRDVPEAPGDHRDGGPHPAGRDRRRRGAGDGTQPRLVRPGPARDPVHVAAAAHPRVPHGPARPAARRTRPALGRVPHRRHPARRRRPAPAAADVGARPADARPGAGARRRGGDDLGDPSDDRRAGRAPDRGRRARRRRGPHGADHRTRPRPRRDRPRLRRRRGDAGVPGVARPGRALGPPPTPWSSATRRPSPRRRCGSATPEPPTSSSPPSARRPTGRGPSTCSPRRWQRDPRAEARTPVRGGGRRGRRTRCPPGR
jgi:hypothetical protein